MPQAPYALLRASINGGAVTTGGFTVPASATVQLSADPSASVGATIYKYEIYGYPIGFSVPSGWSTDSHGVYFYSTSATPPVFTLPSIANWGKFMLRLTLNNAISTNAKVIPPTQLIDESTALSMLSPNGLADVGALESNQFGATWVPPVQASLRAIDTAVTTVAGANVKPPAKLVSSVNIASLSGEQTIDSVLTTASRVLLVNQTTSSQNGLWVTGSGAWTRPTDFSADGQVIVGQSVFITSGTVFAKTNWQLTSGSTISGAKTYAQFAGSGGGGAGITIPITTVIFSNVASLGSAPSSNDGYSFSNGDLVGLGGQTTTTQNGLYSYSSGALSLVSPQPADETLLRATRGLNFINSLYSFHPGALTPVGASTGTIIGANGTVITYAPDPASGTNKQVLNEGIDIQSIPNDAAFHTVYTFNCVGRGVTTGSVTLIALVKLIDGSKVTRLRTECEFFAGAPPTQLEVIAADINDDSGGSGGYLTSQIVISSNSVIVQVKNNQGSSVHVGGVVSGLVLAP